MEKAPKSSSVEGIAGEVSDCVSECELVRRLAPGRLSFKYILMAVLVLLTAAFLFQPQDH